MTDPWVPWAGSWVSFDGEPPEQVAELAYDLGTLKLAGGRWVAISKCKQRRWVMTTTKVISCDRCGQQPLSPERVETLSLSPALAKQMQGLPDGHHMVDLCPHCQLDFKRFMNRELGELATRSGKGKP